MAVIRLKRMPATPIEIWHVHFKDCHPDIAARSREEEWDYFESVGNGVFCELGNGEVDFPAFLGGITKAGL